MNSKLKPPKKNKIKLIDIKTAFKKTVIIAFSLIIMQIVISSAASAYSTGLIANWKFDENTGTIASDSSYNNDNGTIRGAALTVGKIGNALSFDGINDYVDAGNKPGLQITGPISLEGWIKINDLSVSSSLFGRGHGLGDEGNFGYFLTYYAPTKSLYFDTYSTTKRDALRKSNAIIDNNWHHVAATWDGTTSVNGKKLYIDGVLIAQKTSAIAAMGNPSYNFKIGIDSINYRPAKATIDEVKVYNRALSASEILADYNQASSEPTPIATSDTIPPAISAISSSNIASSSATISWTTNEASNSQVEYGTTTNYGSSTTLDTNLVTARSQFLSGLSSSTLYHYRVKSKDAAGNLATSGDYTFTTNSITTNGSNISLKLTIDHTKINAPLSDFPVMVHLSRSSGTNSADTSAVFTELGNDANRKKISITTASGKELYVEIEKWDTANKEAWLWVKVPSISSGQDTVLYLTSSKDRADNTNMVGDTGSYAAQNVWDSGYVAVYHMNDIGSVVKDSTQNAHDGIKKGGTPDPVSGKLGPAALFTGTNYIEVPDQDHFSLVNTRHLIVSTWFSPSSLVMPTTDTDDYQIRLMSKTSGTSSEWTLNYYNDGSARDQGIAWYLCNLAGGLCTGHYMWPYGNANNNIGVNEWEQLTGRGDEDPAVINGVSRTHWVSTYKNGDYRNGQTMDATARIVSGNGNAPFVMGHDLSWPDSWVKGRLDEVRIESAPRSDAWINASYSSESDILLSIS